MTRMNGTGRIAVLVALMLGVCGGFGGAADGGGAISVEQAKSIALAQTGGGQIMDIGGHYRGHGMYIYRLEIVGDSGAYHVEIDANTGAIFKFIQKHGYKGWKGPHPVPSPATGGGLGVEQAQALALAQTGGGYISETDIDVKKNGRIIYEFEIINQGVKYEIEIDGLTGAILEFERDSKRYRHYPMPVPQPGVASTPASVPTPAPAAAPGTAPLPAPGAKIDAARAMALAVEKAGGGTMTGYSLETSGGRLVHDIILVKDNKRHAMEVDDENGTVRELSVRDMAP